MPEVMEPEPGEPGGLSNRGEHGGVEVVRVQESVARMLEPEHGRSEQVAVAVLGSHAETP